MGWVKTNPLGMGRVNFSIPSLWASSDINIQGSNMTIKMLIKKWLKICNYPQNKLIISKSS